MVDLRKMTVWALAEHLASEFPAFSDEIAETLKNDGDDRNLSLHLAGDVFRVQILAHVKAVGDRSKLESIFSLVERILLEGDEFVVAATVDEILPKFLSSDTWARLTQILAGPRLAAELDNYFGSSSWRAQLTGFGEDPRPPARELLVQAYWRDTVLYFHCYQRTMLGRLSATMPFMKIPSNSSSVVVGRTVRAMLEELDKVPPDADIGMLSEFLDYVGGALSWQRFYAQATSVQVEAANGSRAAQVWPTRMFWRDGIVRHNVLDSIEVDDWIDAESLGTAVLDALSVSAAAESGHKR